MLGKLLLATAVVLAAIHSTSAQAWSASTEWADNYGAHRADINNLEVYGESGWLAGGWAARTSDRNQWLMRDLGGDVSVVTGIITKGRNNNPGWGYSNQYVKSYTISYGVNNGDGAFYTDAAGRVVIFPGNTDRDTAVINNFSDYNGPITARYVKIHPRTWNGVIAMRAEIVTEPPVDIVLTFDLSSSISMSDHAAAKTFMDSFHQCPVLQGKRVEVGIILYNCVPWTHAYLGEYAIGGSGLMYRIMDIPYTGGQTRTGPGLRHTRVTPAFREESKRAAVILTDGTTEDPAGVATEAAAARDAGINLYGVGVGTFVNQAGLVVITGDAQRIFGVSSDPCIAAQKIMDDLNA